MQKDYASMNDADVKRYAKMRYYAKRGFFIHLSLYLIISGILVGIYFLTGQGFPWFAIPIGIWALVIIRHFFSMNRSLRRIDGNRDLVDMEADRLKNR